MRVLILGGTGKISTGITRRLIERGDDVVLFNRGTTGSLIDGGYTTITGDRKSDLPAFEKQMAEAGTFDCVIDMICHTPEEAESAVRAFSGRTGHYIFTSSVDAYTKPAAAYPITEDAEREPPKAFLYGYNKARCEDLFFAAHERGELAVTCIRPGHTYGEGGNNLIHPPGFGNCYLNRMKRDMPVILHGNGQSVWPTCHRNDVAAAFVGAICNEKAMGRGYHVTGEELMTWQQYHEGIAKAMGYPAPRFVYIPTDALERMLGEQAMLCKYNFTYNNIYDNTAAHEDLGFKVTIKWVDGVRPVIEWLDQNGLILPAEEFPIYDRVIETWEKATASLTV